MARAPSKLPGDSGGRLERLGELRAQVAAIDERLGAVDGRLAEVPGEDEATRLAAVRGELTQRKTQEALAALRDEQTALVAERDGLARDRDAVTLVLGDLEAGQREADELLALDEGRALQDQIVGCWERVAEAFAVLAAEWERIEQAERELAVARERVGGNQERRAELVSPSEPLPVNFHSFLGRLYDAAVDPRQLGHGRVIYYGRIGALLPDLSAHHIRPGLRLPTVQPFNLRS